MAHKNQEGDKERRTLERFNLKIPARIEPYSSENNGGEVKFSDLLTSDICSGGAFFHTTRPLPEGTDVKIDLVLPVSKLEIIEDDTKKAYIKVTGTVLRSESKGMAICFSKNYEINPLRESHITRH
ncbi:PilZ domain-containing protein [Thermodesulfobacteriota bacterium]